MTRAMPPPSTHARHWALDPDVVQLNHGSFGACPVAVQQEQARLRAEMERNPTRFFLEALPPLWNGARQSLAAFLDADPEGLAFVTNATTGVNAVLNSLKIGSDDEIVVIDHAYQACRNAVEKSCARAGAKLVQAAFPFPPIDDEQIIDAILAKLTDRTRLVMIDTVTSPTALRLPFQRIVAQIEERGIDVLVDAAHGVGLLPMDLEKLGAAYVTGNCHKWLCTPKGSGFLYVRSDRRSQVAPLTISHGAAAPQDRRFREMFDWQGTQDPTPWLCIPRAIDHLATLLPGGWPALMERNHALALSAHKILTDCLQLPGTPAAFVTAMVTFQIRAEENGSIRSALAPDPLVRDLLDKFGIQAIAFTWPQHEARYLRVSTAAYNSEEEIHYLADALSELGISAAAEDKDGLPCVH